MLERGVVGPQPVAQAASRGGSGRRESF